MIAYLSGKIKKLKIGSAILVVNNVGYDIKFAKNVYEKISEGNDVDFFIHSHIKEDQFSLFAFLCEDSLQLFRKFLSITGIGPKSALEISSLPTEKIKNAIFNDDAEYLSSVPGIGKKTANRIILELKNKLPKEEKKELELNIDKDAFDALVGLGFDKEIISDVILSSKDFDKLKSSEEIIKLFLQKHK